MTLNNYDDLKGYILQYIEDDRKKLFKVGNILISFRPKIGKAWRILTNLEQDRAEGLCRFLNDQYLNVFSLGDRAWFDLKNKPFTTPVMTSQINATYLTIDMIQGIIAAFQQIGGAPRIIRRRRAGTSSIKITPKKIKTIELPQQKSKLSVIKRLKKGN